MKADEIAEGRRLLERHREHFTTPTLDALNDWLHDNREALLSAAEQLEAAKDILRGALHDWFEEETDWIQRACAMVGDERLTKIQDAERRQKVVQAALTQKTEQLEAARAVVEAAKGAMRHLERLGSSNDLAMEHADNFAEALAAFDRLTKTEGDVKDLGDGSRRETVMKAIEAGGANGCVYFGRVNEQGVWENVVVEGELQELDHQRCPDCQDERGQGEPDGHPGGSRQG